MDCKSKKQLLTRTGYWTDTLADVVLMMLFSRVQFWKVIPPPLKLFAPLEGIPTPPRKSLPTQMQFLKRMTVL